MMDQGLDHRVRDSCLVIKMNGISFHLNIQGNPIITHIFEPSWFPGSFLEHDVLHVAPRAGSEHMYFCRERRRGVLDLRKDVIIICRRIHSISKEQ
jgi:hypothetical protein